LRGRVVGLIKQSTRSLEASWRSNSAPVAVVCGSVFGAATGTVFSLVLGFGTGAAMLAALAAMIMLPLLRVLHPPGIALAMCPALLHLGPWFALEVVLPFTLVAVISWAAISCLLRRLPRYPMTPSIRIG